MGISLLYILIATGYVVLLVYVSNSRKRSVQKTSSGKAGKELKDLSIKVIMSRILSVDVQQFMANAISSLVILRHNREEMDELPKLRHAFPFAVAEHNGEEERTLSEGTLNKELQQCANETGISISELKQQIHYELHAFTRTQESIIARRLLRPHVNVRDGIDEIIREYPMVLNKYEPLSLAKMEEIIQGENIRVESIRELKLLSSCVTYLDKMSKKRGVKFFLKGGLHPILKTFLLGHELGHWWLHLKRGKKLENPDVYLHSSHEWGPREEEADKVALALMFPTPYLAWLEIENELNADYIIADLVKKLPDDTLSENLTDSYRKYIKRRIEYYHQYKKYLEQSLLKFRLREAPLKEELVEHLSSFLEGQGYAWARLDSDYNLVDCGNAWAGFFDLKAEYLRGKKLSIIKDFTPEELRPRVEGQLEYKKTKRKTTLYFSKYIHPYSNDKVVDVLLKTFPIIKDDTYVGSFGLAARYPLEVSAT